MLKVGLTGGIACGKSQAAEWFKKMNVPVIDADEISRRMTRRGTSELSRIVECFGDEVLDKNGNINRPFMRALIYNNPSARKQLNAILHPAIRKQIEQEVELLTTPYCVIVVPLLLEAGMQDMVDYIITIDCPIEMQVQRIIKRDQCNETDAMKIINSQLDRNKRMEVSDIVINNVGKVEDLQKKINELHTSLTRKTDGYKN